MADLLFDSSPRSARILCVGRIVAEYISDQYEAILSKVRSWSMGCGGSVGNVALNLGGLGADVRFVGCVGADERGEFLRRALTAGGVDVRFLVKDLERPTGYLRTVRKPNAQIEFVPPDEGAQSFADFSLSAGHLSPEAFDGVQFFVPQSMYLGTPNTQAATYRALEIAEEVRSTTYFDINFRSFAWKDSQDAVAETLKFAERAQFIQGSADEFRWLLGTTRVEEIAVKLPNAAGIIVTHGAVGAIALIYGTKVKTGAFEVSQVDPTGAGDAFAAGLLYVAARSGSADSLKERESLSRALEAASAAGALCVTKEGAARTPASQQVVADFIASRPPLKITFS